MALLPITTAMSCCTEASRTAGRAECYTKLVSSWHPVTPEEAVRLERELARELPVGHVLHGRVVRALAERYDRDDVAFEVEGERTCVVHLTWQVEKDPNWPISKFVEALVDNHDEEDSAGGNEG